MKIEIKSWITGGILFAVETDNWKLAVEAAVKSRADLTGADLTGADLTGAVLTGAVLTGADLTGAVLTGVPVVPNLHQSILAAIEHGGKLDMSTWHTCETTHCRAGWAVTLAGGAGKALEGKIGPAAAGALITLASCPWMKRVPNFYASNEAAMADIKACAEREAQNAKGEKL